MGGNYGFVSYASPGAATFNGPASTQGSTVFLVCQLQPAGTNLIIKFYANPALGKMPPATPTDITTCGNIAFDTIRLGSGSSYKLDEVRIRNSWASVVLMQTPPTLMAVSNRMIGVGMTLSITNVAMDTNLPMQALTFSLPAAPANANINAASGVITWRTSVTQANTMNPFTVIVTDNGTPSMSATQSFAVTVTNMVAQLASMLSSSGSQLTMQVDGDGGPDYQVQLSTNLVDWAPEFTTNSPALPFVWSCSTTDGPVHFFRILAGPPLP